jgi:predicted ArsR family transcriptional regulator
VGRVDRFDALGDRQLRRALLFVRERARSVTADELSRALAIPRGVARWRLEKLVAAGVVQTGFERRTGRRGPGAGRPAKTYAPIAETAAIEFPRRRYEILVGLLAGVLPRRGREQRLAEVGVAYAGELAAAMRLRPAASLSTALERVCRGLGRLGFHAAVEAASPDSAAIVSATCPLRPLIVEHPEAAAIDQGMWRGLIALATAAGDRATVTCSTHDCLERDRSCRILVSLVPDASAINRQ